jgi:hypothetical protein
VIGSYDFVVLRKVSINVRLISGLLPSFVRDVSFMVYCLFVYIPLMIFGQSLDYIKQTRDLCLEVTDMVTEQNLVIIMTRVLMA